MKKKFLLYSFLILFSIAAKSQRNTAVANKELFFVSDTQQPMFVEKLWLKPDHNLKATAGIFSSLLQAKPASLYMLGDVVGLGSSNRKWKKVDMFLNSCRSEGTTVCAVLGNHEVMGLKKKGMANFQKRFPMNVNTGYVSVEDSVAVVLLNSNFSKLSKEEVIKQNKWYKETLASLDINDAIKAVIVCCHHAPYTNSKIVKSSARVQEYFAAEYIKSKKASLFITGHSHAFEHFKMMGKDFLVIGGGGGLHQPLRTGNNAIKDLASGYKPLFHYLSVKRLDNQLLVTSHAIGGDFKSFATAYHFNTDVYNSIGKNARQAKDSLSSAGTITTGEIK